MGLWLWFTWCRFRWSTCGCIRKASIYKNFRDYPIYIELNVAMNEKGLLPKDSSIPDINKPTELNSRLQFICTVSKVESLRSYGRTCYHISLENCRAFDGVSTIQNRFTCWWASYGFPSIFLQTALTATVLHISTAWHRHMSWCLLGCSATYEYTTYTCTYERIRNSVANCQLSTLYEKARLSLEIGEFNGDVAYLTPRQS